MKKKTKEKIKYWGMLVFGILTYAFALFGVIVLVFPKHESVIDNQAARIILPPTSEEGVEVNEDVYRIIKCESQWKFDAVGDGGKAFGLAQFHRPTFDWLVELSGLEGLDYYEPKDQIVLLDWALKNNREYLWTCK